MLSIEMIKHVVFDFDGVIVDSERQKFSDLQKILQKYNYNLDNSKFNTFIGKKRGQFLKEIGFTDVDKIMVEVHEIDKTYTDLKIVSGLNEFLEFLSQNNVKMHIATGSSKIFVSKILNQKDIARYFTEIITGDDIKESKPNPAVYLEMIKRIGCKRVIVIEDSPAGIHGAKKAGLFVIGLGMDLESDIEFGSYAGLIEYLKR